MIGTDVVAKAAPDGYTILMVSAAHTINPAMIKKLPYDSVKEFTPLALIADVPTAFVLHPAFPAKTVKEFIAIARARPGEINYSTSGSGTVGHLAAELLGSMARIKMVHVPYKGTGPSMIDLVASTPDEYDQFNRAEIAKWIKVVGPGRYHARIAERRGL